MSTRVAANWRRRLRYRSNHPELGAASRRSKIALLLDEGWTYRAIQRELHCGAQTIAMWKKHCIDNHETPSVYLQRRPRPPSRGSRILQATLRRRVIALTTDGEFRWSLRSLARESGVSHMTVSRALRRMKLRRAGAMSEHPEYFRLRGAYIRPWVVWRIVGLYVDRHRAAVAFELFEDPEQRAEYGRSDRIPPLPSFPAAPTAEAIAAGLQVLPREQARPTVTTDLCSFLASAWMRGSPRKPLFVYTIGCSQSDRNRVRSFLQSRAELDLFFLRRERHWIGEVTSFVGSPKWDDTWTGEERYKQGRRAVRDLLSMARRRSTRLRRGLAWFVAVPPHGKRPLWPCRSTPASRASKTSV